MRKDPEEAASPSRRSMIRTVASMLITAPLALTASCRQQAGQPNANSNPATQANDNRNTRSPDRITPGKPQKSECYPLESGGGTEVPPQPIIIRGGSEIIEMGDLLNATPSSINVPPRKFKYVPAAGVNPYKTIRHIQIITELKEQWDAGVFYYPNQPSQLKIWVQRWQSGAWAPADPWDSSGPDSGEAHILVRGDAPSLEIEVDEKLNISKKNKKFRPHKSLHEYPGNMETRIWGWRIVDASNNTIPGFEDSLTKPLHNGYQFLIYFNG
jgi:hypothetical protein